MTLTLDSLKKLWPRAQRGLIPGVVDSAPLVFARFEINTPLRLAHFMAQISHESAGGTILEENLRYVTARRICKVWPTRFPNEKAAQPYVRNAQGLANKVYNGRLGNRLNSSDGWDYRGRGLIQITGRDNYAEMGAMVERDFLRSPELAAAPEGTLWVAGAFWGSRPLNAAADADDLSRVTLLINGGKVGLEDRRAWLDKWKLALASPSTSIE